MLADHLQYDTLPEETVDAKLQADLEIAGLVEVNDGGELIIMVNTLPARRQMQRTKDAGVPNVECKTTHTLEGLLGDVFIALVKDHLCLEP